MVEGYTGQHTRYDAEAYDAMVDRAWHPQIGPHRRVIDAKRDVTTSPMIEWPPYALQAYERYGWRPWFYDDEAIPAGVEPGRVLPRPPAMSEGGRTVSREPPTNSRT